MKRFWGRSTIMWCALLFPLVASGLPTLDEQAWNSVWARFERTQNVHLQPGENLQILNYPIPATWGENKDRGALQLQKIAGVIPKSRFALDPGKEDDYLHTVYANIVRDVVLPELSPADQAKLDAASKEFGAAETKFEEARQKFNDAVDKELDRLRKRGETVGSDEYRRVSSGLINLVVPQAKALRKAATTLHNLAAPNAQFADAVGLLEQEALRATHDPSTVGLWNYDSDLAVMEKIKAKGCVGGDSLKYAKSFSSRDIRTSSWSGGGGWSGSFFSLGAAGGGSNYENVFTSDSEFVELNFCDMTYVTVGPGPWWDINLLRAIDRGELKLKEGSVMKRKKILGPDGYIPRLVKGFVVAGSIGFNAHLSTSAITEIKKQSGGSGGFRVGPFHIGGGGGHSEYSKVTSDTSGSYGRSTDYDVPVVLAVVVEPTSAVAAE